MLLKPKRKPVFKIVELKRLKVVSAARVRRLGSPKERRTEACWPMFCYPRSHGAREESSCGPHLYPPDWALRAKWCLETRAICLSLRPVAPLTQQAVSTYRLPGYLLSAFIQVLYFASPDIRRRHLVIRESPARAGI